MNNVSSIITKEKCANKGFFKELKISNKSIYNKESISIKELFLKAIEDKLNLEEIVDYIKSKEIDSIMDIEAKEVVDELSNQIHRTISFLESNSSVILPVNKKTIFNLKGIEVEARVDFIVEREDGTIEIALLKKGKPSLSYKGRKFETKPKNDIELYGLYKVGKEMYPDKEVFASLYHLKSKQDKTGVFADCFESKIGDNLISFDFSILEESEIFEIEDRIYGIISSENKYELSLLEDNEHCENCNFEDICSTMKNNNLKSITDNKDKRLETNNTKKDVPKKKVMLTEEQQNIVDFNNGTVRVNSGAGAGKTTVLAIRILRLLKIGVAPDNILLTTFTNQGVNEIKEKLIVLNDGSVDDSTIDNVEVFTFNSWGNRIIEDNYKALGYSEKPKLAELNESYDILIQILNKRNQIKGFNYKNPFMNFKYAKGVIVELFNKLSYLKSLEYKNKSIDNTEKDILEVYKEYKEKMKEMCLIEYRDQIGIVESLIRSNSPILERYVYEHIIVDEFQDSNASEVTIINHLNSQETIKSLMVIGDDSQGIFGFKGATNTEMINFCENFKNVSDMFISKNFRSTKEIVSFSNEILEKNVNKIDKTIESGCSEDNLGIIEVIEKDTEEQEYEAITIKIKELLDFDENSEIAIISRTKNELSNISKHLLKENIPFVFAVSEKLLDIVEFRTLISFSKFYIDMNKDVGLLDYILLLKDKKELNLEVRKELESYRNRFEAKLDTIETEEDNLKFYYSCLEAIGVKNEICMEFIDELKSKEYSSVKEIVIYLTKLEDYDDNKFIKLDDSKLDKGVILTTSHSSKGNEYETVFSLLDKYREDDDILKTEEERRVIYVSVTRAKKNLYLCISKNEDKSRNKGIVNIFIQEIREIIMKGGF